MQRFIGQNEIRSDMSPQKGGAHYKFSFPGGSKAQKVPLHQVKMAPIFTFFNLKGKNSIFSPNCVMFFANLTK